MNKLREVELKLDGYVLQGEQGVCYYSDFDASGCGGDLKPIRIPSVKKYLLVCQEHVRSSTWVERKKEGG